MGKKKVRDFDKVKLKLGKTLKRQSETIVDLSKKKILLPKEKDHIKIDEFRDPNAVIYYHIRNLQTSSHVCQLSALSCIQSIFLPYINQINSDWKAHPFVCCNDRSLQSLDNLFGSNFSQNEISCQLGDLFGPLECISRHSSSSKIPSQIADLCKMIALICSAHPRMQGALSALNNVTLALLLRSEFWYRTAGVRTLAYFMDARHIVASSFVCDASPFVPFNRVDELYSFIDSVNATSRRIAYARLLLRHFESYRENSAYDAISSRKMLLMAVMKYLRDVCYTTYITPSFPLDSHLRSKLHPFLSAVEFSGSPFDSSLLEAQHHACLRSTWLLSAPNVLLEKLSEPSLPQSEIFAAKGKEHQQFVNRSLTKFEEDAELEGKLIGFVCKEGHKLLDELIHDPSQDTVFGLIYTCRALRAFIESQSVEDFNSSSTVLSDMREPLTRFVSQLSTMVPPDFADDTLLPSDAIGTTTTGAGGPANKAGDLSGGGSLSGFTRKNLKKAFKRSVKMARRQEAAAAASLKMEPNGMEVDDAQEQASKDDRRLGRSEVLSHLLKQQILQLVWSLVCAGAYEGDEAGGAFVAEFARSLAGFLLSPGEGEKGDTELPTLAFLDKASSALSWRWIHTLDFCLLYSSRIRQINERASKSVLLLLAPVAAALAYIVHRWCHRQIKVDGASKALRAPRMIVRSAGVLVAFFHTHQLGNRQWSPVKSDWSTRFDGAWINSILKDLKGNSASLLGSEGDLFTIFVSDLVNFVQQESSSTFRNKTRWLWAAACLSSLAEIKYADVENSLEASSDLREALLPLRSWASLPTRLDDALIHLPDPSTATYASARAWKCFSVERINAQDVPSSKIPS